MIFSVAYSIPVLIFFITLPGILLSVLAESEVTCISNYAEMKQALFQEGTGNKERLLYAFTPPNAPLPHYIWVYYFHNQSSEWSDVLTCPLENSLRRCPESSTNTVSDMISNHNSSHENSSVYHIVFWGDSPLLINLDIPLLKLFSYDSILEYLEMGSCVQLVVPPFCGSVNSASERDILKFTTSYLRSYSTSEQESSRDYVLHCYDKFGTEFTYDAYLLGSLFTICLGSGFIIVFLGLKMCAVTNKSDKQEETMAKKQHEENQDEKTDKEKANNTYKRYFSLVLIIEIITFLLLLTDTVEFSRNGETVKDAFLYGYGSISIILFGFAWLSVVTKATLTSIYLIMVNRAKLWKSLHRGEETDCKEKPHDVLFLKIILGVGTVLTLASFSYILSRVFLIGLAIATYPFELSFILLAVGSGIAALLFVVWITIHIAADSRRVKLEWWDIIRSLVPYVAMSIVLGGFLLSYIYVILRASVHTADPVTSLVSALVPAAIAFVAEKNYDKQLEKINDRKQENTQEDEEAGIELKERKDSSTL